MLFNHEPSSQRASRFLIRCTEKDNIRFQRDIASPKRQQADQLSDGRTLHIERTASPKISVFDHTGKRRFLPEVSFRRNDIHMIQQENRFLHAGTLETRKNISTSGSRFENPRLDPFTVKDLFEELRGLDLITRWVGGIDLDIAAQQRDRFIF